MKKFILEWKGKKYGNAVTDYVSKAVLDSALYVVKTTKKSFGEGQTATNKAGLNKGRKLDQNYAKGKPQIDDLGAWNSGGTHTSKDGEKIDRIYWNSTEKKWVQSSKPGTPPNKQSGDLRRSITFSRTKSGTEARVGPQDELVYGRIQELGGKAKNSYLPPRPYLKPAFESSFDTINKLIKQAVAKAATKL